MSQYSPATLGVLQYRSTTYTTGYNGGEPMPVFVCLYFYLIVKLVSVIPSVTCKLAS